MGRRGFPLTLALIGDYASEIHGTPVGYTWPKRFKKRHPDLKVKWATGLEECRAKSLNPTAVSEYFELLRDTIDRYDIQRKNIYNMDEKGIQLGVGAKIHVIVDRDQKTVQHIESGKRDLVTIIEFICADGTVCHPSVIFEGKRRDLRWGEDNPCNARSLATFSPVYQMLTSFTASPSLLMAGRIKTWEHCGSRRILHQPRLHVWTIQATIVFSSSMAITVTSTFLS